MVFFKQATLISDGMWKKKRGSSNKLGIVPDIQCRQVSRTRWWNRCLVRQVTRQDNNAYNQNKVISGPIIPQHHVFLLSPFFPHLLLDPLLPKRRLPPSRVRKYGAHTARCLHKIHPVLSTPYFVEMERPRTFFVPFDSNHQPAWECYGCGLLHEHVFLHRSSVARLSSAGPNTRR